MGISKYHPTWIALLGDELELGSSWPPCWHSYLVAGFRHPKRSDRGDTAFQADIILSGLATAMAGSPRTRANAGEAARFYWYRWEAHSRGIPGTAVAPGHLPYGAGCPGGPPIRPFSLPIQSATSLLTDCLVQEHYYKRLRRP